MYYFSVILKFIGKTVAIIGGGPSGLSAAYYLSIQGVKVTLYESLPVLGGFMRVVIGGGFTANDASRTSIRLGAENVYIMYRRDVDRPGYPSMNG